MRFHRKYPSKYYYRMIAYVKDKSKIMARLPNAVDAIIALAEWAQGETPLPFALEAPAMMLIRKRIRSHNGLISLRQEINDADPAFVYSCVHKLIEELDLESLSIPDQRHAQWILARNENTDWMCGHIDDWYSRIHRDKWKKVMMEHILSLPLPPASVWMKDGKIIRRKM